MAERGEVREKEAVVGTDGGVSLAADDQGALDEGSTRVVDAVQHRLGGAGVSAYGQASGRSVGRGNAP